MLFPLIIVILPVNKNKNKKKLDIEYEEAVKDHKTYLSGLVVPLTDDVNEHIAKYPESFKIPFLNQLFNLSDSFVFRDSQPFLNFDGTTVRVFGTENIAQCVAGQPVTWAGGK